MMCHTQSHIIDLISLSLSLSLSIAPEWKNKKNIVSGGNPNTIAVAKDGGNIWQAPPQTDRQLLCHTLACHPNRNKVLRTTIRGRPQDWPADRLDTTDGSLAGQNNTAGPVLWTHTVKGCSTNLATHRIGWRKRKKLESIVMHENKGYPMDTPQIIEARSIIRTCIVSTNATSS